MHVVLIAALTLDGRITRHATPGVTFGSPEDQRFLKEKLRECDASIMGASTYRLHREAIRSLKPANRLRVIWTRQPESFSADESSGSLEFRNGDAQGLVEALRGRGVRRCALLGGAETYTSFLKANLVHELWLTYEPVLVGTGLSLATEALDSMWKRVDTVPLNRDTFAVRYVRGTAEAPKRQRVSFWSHVACFLAWVFGLIAIGGLAGAILFPLFGPFFGAELPGPKLMLAGLKFGSFYFMIWAPGVAIVATVMRAYKKAGPR
ncbi:MAG: dihydrofolate reductase family protein [Opitutaceae bacterium]|nr:dihydrofolate reductase family protein [Opitutaceae bacterium]